MPVIINELEVVVEAPKRPSAAPAPPSPPPTQASPRDVGDVLAWQQRHALRLIAH